MLSCVHLAKALEISPLAPELATYEAYLKFLSNSLKPSEIVHPALLELLRRTVRGSDLEL